jgi:hypothetical protein
MKMNKKDLYEVTSMNYAQMSKETLRDIAKEALYALYELLSEEDYLEKCEQIVNYLELTNEDLGL